MNSSSREGGGRGKGRGTHRFGPVACLLQLSESLLGASAVSSEFAEEGVELLVEKQGQHSAEAGFGGPGIQRDPQLARVFLALVEGEEALSPALRRLGSDVEHCPEGQDSRILLTERLAKA